MPNTGNINRYNVNKSPLKSLLILGAKGAVWEWPTAQTWHYWQLQRAALDGPVTLKGRDSDAPGGCSPRPSPPLLGWLRRHQLWNCSIQKDCHLSPKRKWLEKKTKGLLLSHKHLLHEWSCISCHRPRGKNNAWRPWKCKSQELNCILELESSFLSLRLEEANV